MESKKYHISELGFDPARAEKDLEDVQKLFEVVKEAIQRGDTESGMEILRIVEENLANLERKGYKLEVTGPLLQEARRLRKESSGQDNAVENSA